MNELEILDSTLGLRPGPVPGDDAIEMQRLSRGVSILTARFVLFNRVISHYQRGTAEFLISSLTAEPHFCFRYHDELANLFPQAVAVSKPDQFSGGEVIDFWRRWWTQNQTPALCGVPWKEHCPRLRKTIEAYETCDSEVMLTLGVDEDPVVRYALARNPHLSEVGFAILCEDEEEDVRIDLVQRGDTPPEVLRKLAKDNSRVVRNWVAINPRTPMEVLSGLAADPDRELRLNLLRNPSIPNPVLTELSGCGDAEVEAEAKQAMSMPGWTSEMWEAINGRKVDKVTQLLTINKDLAKLVDKSGATPLHKVATPPITETAYLCAKALLESRAGVNAQDLVGRTPLCLAVGAMQPIGVKLVKQLLRAGGDLNSMTNDGKTVIQLAHESGYRPMTDFLRQYVLQQGIDIKE